MDPNQVTLKNLSEYVNFLITEFYQHNLQPYFTALADDAVWFGARQKQMLESKDEIVASFRREQVNLLYQIGAIYTRTIPCTKCACETISLFDRIAKYPSGETVMDRLCYHLSWVKKETWQMRVVSIFVRQPNPEMDLVYPLHVAENRGKEATHGMLMLREKGTTNTIFLLPQNIAWAESVGHFCRIQCSGTTITVAVELRKLEEMAKPTLLRCHSGYLVNPRFVSGIHRFRICMIDGTEIPVPEKRYTDIRKKLQEAIQRMEFTAVPNEYMISTKE